MELDDSYGELRELKIDAQNTELLHVHFDKWNERLFRYERKYNLGCVSAFILLFIILVMQIVDFVNPFLLLGVLIVAVLLKLRNAKRASNLRKHGLFKYEIAQNKIVRYSESSYDIFHFKDIKTFKEKSIGIVLKTDNKNYDLLGLSLYRPERKSQLILPRDLYSFEQVKAFLKQGNKSK